MEPCPRYWEHGPGGHGVGVGPLVGGAGCRVQGIPVYASLLAGCLGHAIQAEGLQLSWGRRWLTDGPGFLAAWHWVSHDFCL